MIRIGIWYGLLFASHRVVVTSAWISSTGSRTAGVTRRTEISFVPASDPHAVKVSSLVRYAVSDSVVALNPLLQSIEPSATVQIFSTVQELQSQGIDVTSLCVGEPDFAPPPNVNQAVIDALQDTTKSYTRYTAVKGTLALRQAIAADLSLRKNTTYHPQTEIIVSSGAKPSVFGALWAVAGSADAVLIPAPYWTSYPEQVKLTGATPIVVETTSAAQYKLTAAQLRDTLEQHTKIKALVLCHPSNPTGSVYTKDELLALVNVLDDYPQVTIVCDEIYERLVYDDMEHVSFASLSPSMRSRTITLNGVSKSHAMTGYRIGYAAAPKHYIDAMTTIQSQLASCACSLSQHAATVALTSTEPSWMTEVVEVMQTKRNYVCERLASIPHLNQVSPPPGAFYVLVNITAYLQPETPAKTTRELSTATYTSDTAFCLALLDQQRLAVVPGSAFGAPGTIRLSYATDQATLLAAMDKLEVFLQSIEKINAELLLH